MEIEPVVAADPVEPNNLATPATSATEPAENANVEPETPATEPASESVETGKKGTKKPWFEGRISELANERNEAAAEAARLRTENEELRARTAAGAAGISEEEIEKIVNSRVDKKLPILDAQREFAQRTAGVKDYGVQQFNNFDDSLAKVNMLGQTWANAVPNLIEAVSKEEAAKIIVHLASDLDDAARIVSLSPAKQIAEFVRMGTKLTEPKPGKPVSNAPAPISTVNTAHANPAAKTVDKAVDAADHHKIRMAERKAKGLSTW